MSVLWTISTKLPFSQKKRLRAAYPYGLFALPLEKVLRIHASSGTTSNPTVVGYSRGDLNTWSELCARVAVAGGARSHDVAQITFGYGLMTGGFGMQAGLERIGATVIPASTGNTQRQLHIMRTSRPPSWWARPPTHSTWPTRPRSLGTISPISTCGWVCSARSRGPTRLRDEIETATGTSPPPTSTEYPR